jgi:hypothetical protein
LTLGSEVQTELIKGTKQAQELQLLLFLPKYCLNKKGVFTERNAKSLERQIGE